MVLNPCTVVTLKSCMPCLDTSKHDRYELFSELMNDFRNSYAGNWHRLEHIWVGFPLPHDISSNLPVKWKVRFPQLIAVLVATLLSFSGALCPSLEKVLCTRRCGCRPEIGTILRFCSAIVWRLYFTGLPTPLRVSCPAKRTQLFVFPVTCIISRSTRMKKNDTAHARTRQHHTRKAKPKQHASCRRCMI